MRDRLGVVAGLLCGAIILAGLPVVTWASGDWLIAAGWTPVARNRIQWPSMMLLGPYGPLMTGVLLGSAAAGGCFLPRLRVVASRRAAVALAVAVCCVALTAVPPLDTPAAFPLVRLHNAAYLGLLVAWAAFLVLGWTDIRGSTRRGTPVRPAVRRLALCCLVPVLVGTLLTALPATGQLARYLLLFPMAAWIGGVAWLTRGVVRA
ncbi:hypothetical protein [Raineyella sp. W15-4]|uniref:hypothetical protein n=1 Tax=Raineyella sp. W15-4 TaxID=3081651 RepID=UPI00295410A8|nr:hypothetical protein [Raineyella sp. W15-4]WOQ17417.1 hypothetical protein R0145_01490 [Raineyella sp. W15-4]